ncbi:MAG: SH3 domain-containing protein [Polyangiaceae bacterium]
MSTSLRTVFAVAASAALALATTACAPPSVDPDTESLVGADENVETNDDALSGSIAVGTQLVSTTNVNLRTGPSTSKTILHVVPEGSTVTVESSTPSSGWYKIKHNGTVGWSFGQYYKIKDTGAPPPSSGGGARGDAIARAKSAVGFSYYWGHGRFLETGPTSSNRGSCSGSCPDCTHSGSYGGDCSGLAAKVWQVPGTNTSLSTDAHPYSTVDFNKDNSKWSTVSRANVQSADAMVYNSNGAGHIFIYDKGDGWGSMYAYECKGCAAGCVAGYRTAGSAYHAIRKAGW